MTPATPTAGLRPAVGSPPPDILAGYPGQGPSIPEVPPPPPTATSISGGAAPAATFTTAHVTPLPKDPVTGTPIPPKGAPHHISRAAMRQHLRSTKELSQDLASDRSEIPEGLGECLDLIAGMAPHQLLRHQRQMLDELRSIAKETLPRREDHERSQPLGWVGTQGGK